jgi:hypothetical protein
MVVAEAITVGDLVPSRTTSGTSDSAERVESSVKAEVSTDRTGFMATTS